MTALIDVLGTAIDYALLFLLDWWPLLVVAALALAIRKPFPRLQLRVRPWFAYAIVFALSITISLSIAIADGVPQPRIHDDYAVFLGGEMFARGHASYPTHSGWRFLEAMHVLQVPSYAPKYPPGQSLVLALGILLFHTALVGSWLAAAAACAAIVWALRALLPLEWAFAGGVFAALHPTMIEWANSYRGGGLAALGGALLFWSAATGVAAFPRGGAAPRQATAATRVAALQIGAIAGLGLALLALTRPYEGVVLAIACATALLVARARPWRALVPMLLVASLGLVALALHDRAVTGSALRLPWIEYARQYDPAPPFLWQQPSRAPHYRNAEFRYWHETMFLGEHRRLREPGGLARALDRKLYFIGNAVTGDLEASAVPYFWPLLLVPLLVWRRESWLPLVVLLAFAFAPLSLAGWLLTHYLAPAAAALAALWTIGFRAIAVRRPWLALVIAIVFLVNTGCAWTQWLDRDPGPEPERQRLMAEAGPGKHLFLVAPDVFGVVANEPDIDRARVVWARDLGDDAEVRALFRDRKVWRVIRSESRARLRLQPLP